MHIGGGFFSVQKCICSQKYFYLCQNSGFKTLSDPTNRGSHIRPDKMGNVNTTCQVSNYSKRNVRVFVTEKAVEAGAFIARGDDPSLQSSSAKCVRVLTSMTQEVVCPTDHFLSIFVEDEDDGNNFSRQIIQNMMPSDPVTVLIYDI